MINLPLNLQVLSTQEGCCFCAVPFSLEVLSSFLGSNSAKHVALLVMHQHVLVMLKAYSV